MTDIFTRKKRSEIMRTVKNKDTNIELKLRRFLFAKGIKFRVKNSLFGKPDIVLPKYKIVIFCDGDFWHGKNYDEEKGRYKKFWIDKIALNIKRDIEVNKRLKEEGWKVLRFWKTEIQGKTDKCINKIMKNIKISLLKN
ncbi:very short patch repair endonuclease [Candidatus Roizmanbacteria bacterium CG_4_10_14_0_8_um_filter_33_9]|uniref:Very short patch repair endonuclease n=1 Tax=Candidatus Roizmanbacteria bacterium CG_4_10_14_0_8_um_filter_33_9 TaxID=1974826 RepID=A0A2M7QJ92_9BACT|nr:MAG: very short patch repair endonuclease [Candidatus Roizmanbacteria bacterium CG_4_10_14_0_8_um_filter_33_9]